MYWYGTGSDSLTETDGSGNLLREFVYFNGKRTARIDLPGGTVHYYFADHLGTLSEEASATGTIENDSDYYPYGGERVIKQNVANEHYKFSGKEWDSESGLDEFGARYYASTLARFMTPDWAARPITVPYAKFGDPQTLNLYTYVENGPLNRIDRDGHYEVNASGCAQDNAKCQKKYDSATQRFEQVRQKDLQSKDPNVRAAAAAYGDSGEKNGVHVGFADLASQHISGSVDASNSTPGGGANGIDIEVTIDFGRAGSAETQTHEGTHVEDDQKFLSSWNPGWGGYMGVLTHGQTEFNAFKAGAEINREHGFGPNDDKRIRDFLRNDPTYGPVLNEPVFDPAKFPAAVAED